MTISETVDYVVLQFSQRKLTEADALMQLKALGVDRESAKERLAISQGQTDILAVQITELLRKKEEAKKRKVHVFRALMSTRSAPLSPAHIEALNLVELEFESAAAEERKVVDCWRLYLAHLNDQAYPRESWGQRRIDLLIDLLYEMAQSLKFSYDKSQIKSGAYSPVAWQETENEQGEARKLWLELLQGRRSLPTHVLPPPPSSTPPVTP